MIRSYTICTVGSRWCRLDTGAEVVHQEMNIHWRFNKQRFGSIRFIGECAGWKTLDGWETVASGEFNLLPVKWSLKELWTTPMVAAVVVGVSRTVAGKFLGLYFAGGGGNEEGILRVITPLQSN